MVHPTSEADKTNSNAKNPRYLIVGSPSYYYEIVVAQDKCHLNHGVVACSIIRPTVTNQLYSGYHRYALETSNQKIPHQADREIPT